MDNLGESVLAYNAQVDVGNDTSGSAEAWQARVKTQTAGTTDNFCDGVGGSAGRARGSSVDIIRRPKLRATEGAEQTDKWINQGRPAVLRRQAAAVGLLRKQNEEQEGTAGRAAER